MSRRLFLDTNVVLDFFLERNPFSIEAESIFRLRQEEKVDFSISSLTLANLAYFITRAKKNPFEIIGTLLEWTRVVELDRKIFEQTLSSRFKDFEDGLQYFSALKEKDVDVIVTRNKSDFRASEILVQTPSEFLKQFSF
jgi:predicted nucleic acid-binding protein